MVLNKKIIQREVDATIKDSKYTEGLGEVILLMAEISVHKRGLNYRYSEFEVEFVIKPRIVDMLLLKVFKYDKAYASAYTFFSLITSTAIIDAIKDIKGAVYGNVVDMYYLEDIKGEVSSLIEVFDRNDVYLDGDVIKLK